MSGATYPQLGAVPNWNLTTPPPVPQDPVGWGDPSPTYGPTYGKGGSLVGMTAINGSLLVGVPHRNKNAHPEGDPLGDTPAHDAWNGLSFIPDATARPGSMTIQESWSAGLSLGTEETGAYHAVPEGSDVVFNGNGVRFWVQANYCGEDWAGHLLVVVLPNLASATFVDRALVPVYEFLGDWNEGPLSPPPGPLGAELSRENYTCESTLNGPANCEPTPFPANCPTTPANQVSGNKLRPVVYVHIPESAPKNAGKDFIVLGLNLDPIDIDTYATTNTKLDTDCGRDDGKYDYMAFIDITGMQAAVTMPPDPSHWQIHDIPAWKAHTTFVRMPPDVPAGWFVGNPSNPPLQPGHDWSFVTVSDPTGVNPPSQQRIVGSGTPKSIALHPSGQFVYLVGSDQGQESVQENATLYDGGWHVPHLYVIDLFLRDLTNQVEVNLLSPVTQVHRFNKLVSAKFGATQNITGSVLVNSTMGMPTTTPAGTTGLTVVGGAPLSVAGPYYPGEFQTDPTARTRMLARRNLAFTAHQDRLYVGTTGRFQSTNPAVGDSAAAIGAVHAFWLAADGTPTWLDTLTVTQEPQGGGTGYYQVSGLDLVPSAWIGAPAARNVVAVTALNSKAATAAQDRFVLLQDDVP